MTSTTNSAHSRQQPPLPGVPGYLSATIKLQLFQDVMNMILYRLDLYLEVDGDLFVTLSLGEQVGNCDLSTGEY